VRGWFNLRRMRTLYTHTHILTTPKSKASNLYINLMPGEKQFRRGLLILTSVGWALDTTHSRSYSSEVMGSNLERNNTTYPKELSLSRIGLDHGGHEIVQCIEPNRVQN